MGLFCFYDDNGYVGDYICFLLEQVKKVLDELFIIVNGKIDKKSKEKLSLYASKIYLRENLGYDGGAFADIIVNEIGRENIKKWDEIVVFNNSFFGFFEPLDLIFKRMNQEDVDFWGIRYIDRGICNYIESYFLVFRYNVVRQDVLFDFFDKNYKYLINGTYKEICSVFERGLFYYLKNKNFLYGSYIKKCKYDIFYSPYKNIAECGLPLLKKKCFNYCETLKLEKCYEFINNNYDYDINILLNEYKQWKLKNMPTDNKQEIVKIPRYDISEKDLLNFLEKNDDIYIMGAGFIAGNIWWSYKYQIKNFMGFIVSKNGKQKDYFGKKVWNISEIKKDSNIVIAMGRKNSKEVANIVIGKYNTLFIYRNL